MTAINIEVDNEYFMVKVQRNSFTAWVTVLTPDQQTELYKEIKVLQHEKYCQQFELDFDKRDAKKVVRRYLKFR